MRMKDTEGKQKAGIKLTISGMQRFMPICNILIHSNNSDCKLFEFIVGTTLIFLTKHNQSELHNRLQNFNGGQ